MPTKYGYIEPAPIVEGDQYLRGAYGSLGGDILQPDGQWDAYLPTDEFQAIPDKDPNACVPFGTLNAGVETLLKRQFGLERNYSDSWLAKATGTDLKGGNDPHAVAEFVRTKGIVLQIDWPNDLSSFAAFYRDFPKSLYTLALAFTSEFLFQHEYVLPNPKEMTGALQHSPLGAGVYAWLYDANKDLYYWPAGYPYVHWCEIYGYVEGQYWKVFDTYDKSHKKIAWDVPFKTVKRYKLTRQIKNDNAWTRFLVWLTTIVYGTTPTVDATAPTPPPTIPPAPDPAPAVAVAVVPQYLWDTKEDVRHSIRVMCDNAGMIAAHKNILTACIYQESRFNPKAIGKPNSNRTRDWGLCQYNDGKNPYTGQPYWIGPGAIFSSTDEVLNDPEKNVRVMIECFKAGNEGLWASYTSGAYKQWLTLVQHPIT